MLLLPLALARDMCGCLNPELKPELNPELNPERLTPKQGLWVLLLPLALARDMCGSFLMVPVCR